MTPFGNTWMLYAPRRATCIKRMGACVTTEELIEAIEAAGFNIGLDRQGYIMLNAERVDGLPFPRDLPAHLRRAVEDRYYEVVGYLLDTIPGEATFNWYREQALHRDLTRRRLRMIEGGVGWNNSPAV